MALSPMMKFYLSLKEKYNDCLLFFRLGDFYEMFFEDAETASRELDLTLTGRDCGLEQRAPMCGVPYHAVDAYISKLIDKGYKVAICEQLSDPATSKGLVDRDVVRIITPGTVVEENILQDKANNYLACVCLDKNAFALAWVDISTGEFCTTQYQLKDGENALSSIEDTLSTLAPKEIIANADACNLLRDSQNVRMGKMPKAQEYPDWAFEYQTAYKLLAQHFNVSTLAKFEFDDKKLSVGSCGAVLNYLNETQKRALPHIDGIKYVTKNKYLAMDANTRRSLELTASVRDGSKKATLLWVLDQTCTNMGARNLRRWIEQPLRDSAAINRRLDGVEELIAKNKIRNNLSQTLSDVRDLERLASRLAYGNTNPRDFVAIKQSLQALPSVKSLLDDATSGILTECNENIDTLDDIAKLIEIAIDDNPPSVIKDGGFVKAGYNRQIDEYRNAGSQGKLWLSQLEAKEREETGIKTLKIGYNKVFGYYIEVSKGQIDKVPFRYQRKQTLTNGERYITQELKEIEDKLLGAQEKAIALELRIFEELKLKLLEVVSKMLASARAVAVVDTLLSFAKASIAGNYVKPVINEKVEQIEITEGRHPVVEKICGRGNFVPNDTLLDNNQNRTMIITGPNMAGKSTYMRQVALIVIMAHIGCFVPAKSAKVSITDRIFTRIGASDDLAYGQSTFMVEMVEVATILQNATFRSLLVLDEIGRGTSTFDGLAIARAVTEEITNTIRCKTMFSTHYHELTELEGWLDGVKNYKILAAERDKGIIFLHRIVRGGTNKSFGIEVAKLAGLPKNVIVRAKEISKILEQNPLKTHQEEELPLLAEAKRVDEENKTATILKELKDIETETLTPLQALVKLSELVNMLKE
ncbi:MAG: DNA mismatch repair protein MutS [Christensenellales bacterium]